MALLHFTDKELACPLTGEIRLQAGFGEALEALRLDYGHPMPVTSCCRSAAHNRAIGGHPRSLHKIDNEDHETDTCALDFELIDGVWRARFISIALRRGWSIAIGSNFLHIDQRTKNIGYPQVIRHYKR